MSGSGVGATVELGAAPAGRFAAKRVGLGTTLGRYRLESVIGKGGMGVVYSAADPSLDRVVALKVLNIGGREAARAKARAQQEARALASLSHPNVVPIYDMGYADDVFYISMELVEGESVRAWLKEVRSTDEIIDCFLAAARGLAAAHDHSIVHRDFKPNNLLVGVDGRVRVLDFGLAQLFGDWSNENPSWEAGDDAVSPDLTQPGVVLGTPRYMSPEQHAGRSVGPASDQYSFCLSLLEALQGRFPFEGAARSVALQKVRYTGARVTGPLAKLHAVIDVGLNPAAGRRHASMRALIAEIERARPKPKSRHRIAWAAAVIGVVSAAAIATTTPTVSRCEAGAQRGREIWGDAAVERLQAAIGSSSHRLADDAARVAGEATRNFGTAWSPAFEEACAAWLADPATTTATGVACLEEQREQVRATLDALAHEPDESTVIAAPEVVARLPNVAECSGAPERTLARRVGSVRALELTAELQAAQTSVARGRHREGVDAYRAVVKAAAEEALLRVEADGLLGLARALAAASEFTEASQHAERAYFKALEAEDERLALRATTSSLRYAADLDPNSADVARWEATAAALLDRADAQQTTAHADLIEARGAVAQARGHVPEAEGHYRRALELSKDLDEPELQIGIRLLNLSSTLIPQRKEKEGLELLLQAKENIEAAAGPNAEALGTVLANLCAASDNLGRHEEAAGHCEDALARLTRVHGVGTPRGAMTKLTLSQAYRNAEQFDRAVATATEGRDDLRAAKGATHRDVAIAEVYLGSALQGSGNLDDAIAAYGRAAEITQDVLGHSNTVYATAMAALGDAQRAAGLYDASERSLRAAIVAQPLDVVGPGQYATLHVDLALSLLDAKQYQKALDTLAIAEDGLASAGTEVRGDAAFAKAKALRFLNPSDASAAGHAHLAIQHFTAAGGRFKQSAVDVRAWLEAAPKVSARSDAPRTP